MQLSSLTESVVELKNDSQYLADAYVNDDDVGDLKTRAINVRDNAQRLIDSFDGINEALGLL